MLTDFLKAEVFQYATDVFLASRGKATRVEVDLQTQRKFGKPETIGEALQISNIVQQAQRSLEYGKALQRGSANLPQKEPPKDYTVSQYGGKYAYRVVIQYVDPNTGERYSSLAVVPSDTPLTEIEIRNNAQDMANTIVNQQGSNPNFSGIDPQDVMSVYIISAGRA